jgi:succinoglycan biosynthesis protein ExoL
MAPKIAYFAHDLTDPAVARRVRMLIAGGAAVTPLGFRRGALPMTAIAGVPAVEIGRSADGRLAKRAISVAAALTMLSSVAQYVVGADVILARNLEMLVLAARARNRYAPAATLVYECLDIHRMLLSRGLDGMFLRTIEAKLWRQVDLVLTSSPAFVRNYFLPRCLSVPVKILENKVLLLDSDCCSDRSLARPAGPPWRIGWFGMIRCRRSLEILSALAREQAGAVEVIIRGRPSGATFPDFEEDVAGRPHVHYAGPYRNPGDIARIYGDIHFVWAIDHFESGQNSDWLLPTRIYEGTFFGAVPIALAGVETSAWLAEHAVGITLAEPLRDKLRDFIQQLDQITYAKLARAVAAIPGPALTNDLMDCRELVQALCRTSGSFQARQSDDAQSIALARKTSHVRARR